MADNYTQYYLRQAEGHGVPAEVFRYTQKGAGIGSYLGGLFRRVFPLLRSGVKAVGKEALSTGVNLLKDVFGGRSLGESVGARVTEAGTNLSRKVGTKLQGMVGSGYKMRKRKRRAQSKRNTKTRKVTKRAPRKAKKSIKNKDIFG
jgi:hypothetical protein